MGPGITLTKSGMAIYVVGRTQGYRFTVQASEAHDGIPNEIFVYIVNTTLGDSFVNIASPGDILEIPVGAPLPGGQFYRTSSVDLVFGSLDLANSAWEVMKTDVNELVQTLTYFQNMTVQEVITIGTESSSSSSSSDSA